LTISNSTQSSSANTSSSPNLPNIALASQSVPPGGVNQSQTFATTASTAAIGSQTALLNNNNPPIYDPRYLYLIDCRLDKKLYNKQRINTALHFSDILNEHVYLSPPVDNYSMIVFYDQDGSFLTINNAPNQTNNNNNNITISHSTSLAAASSTTSHLANSLSSTSKSTSSSASTNNINDTLANISGEAIIAKVKAKINCNANKTVYVLSGGFECFHGKFPFMCSSNDIRSMVDRHKYLTIYPNCVIENQIYIGSGVQAKNWKIIKDLRITHIVNCSIEHECVFKDEIKYLHVKIEDTYQENIYKVLNKTLEFINDAFDKYYQDMLKAELLSSSKNLDSTNSNANSQSNSYVNMDVYSQQQQRLNSSSSKDKVQPPRILIHCNLGISRSSSILIAYLISRYKICLYAAFSYAKDKRLQIAPNYSFLRQLKQFEETNGGL
jgi:hypothetical protein